MRREEMAKKVLYAVGLLIKTVLLCCTAAQQWEAAGQPEVSKFGMMLQRHIFKRITGAGLSDVCLRGCYADVRCQSFNYVFTQDICELSNRTKEARPEDYVPNPERFYFKRDYKRVPLGSIPELPAETCQEIKMSEGGQAVSGKYWFHSIVPERTVLAPCDMKTEDMDECNSTIPVCDANAECANTIGSHSCSCKAGFTGNGKKCVDVDECANKSHDCDANASCNNTAGSYRCTCNSWYQGNGTSCYFRGLNNSVILTSLDYKNYTGKLLSYLEPVLLSSEWSRFVKCWHAKTDGWAASTFHSNCDGRGPTVTIIKVNDSIFGGYTDVSWGPSGTCDWSYSTKAFLFSFNNVKGYNPVKLTQYRNQQHAMYTCSSYGPTFGSGFDIHIYDDAVNNPQHSYTECGQTYSNPAGYSGVNCGFFTGSRQFTPSDIEVFFEIGGLGASDILGSLDPNKYLGKLISFLDPVLPTASHSDFVRCWHAKVDGWAASTFHSNCDGRGPTVTIIKVNDFIFGGYTDVSWGPSGSCFWSYATKAFLFSFNNIRGYNPVKLTQYRYQQYAMYTCSSYGPTFGWGHDIRIYDDAVNNQHSHTECGQTYSNPVGYSGENCGFFTGSRYFTPSDIEVFFEIGGLSASIILGSLDPNKYLKKLISFLDPVLPIASRTDFVRCWHAKIDGWAASTFHSNCDGRGPTVTIVKVNEYIFGGYTDVSWSGAGSCAGYSYASKAFIFSLYNVKGYNPVKLTQYQNQQYAMYRCNTYGPTFGAGNGHDIYISDGSGNNQNSYTRCGSTYTTPSGYSTGDCGFFTGGSHFSPTDVEVFYEAGLGLSAILRSLDYNQYLKVLFSYLDPVLINKERSRFVRCWHAKTDGWAASTFHSNCDGRGPTVTIIKVNSYIFGGYTDVSWTSGSCAYSSASKAFVFSLYNVKGYNPVKLTQYRYQQYAMYRCSSRGPTFGWAHDIRIYDDAVNNQHSYTRCGGTYSNPTGYSAGDCKFFTGASSFTPSDIEVFFEITN